MQRASCIGQHCLRSHGHSSVLLYLLPMLRENEALGEFITELGLALVDGVQGCAEPLGGCSRHGQSEAGGDAIRCQRGFNLK